METNYINPADLTPEDKNMGMLCHLISLAGLVIPFGNLIGPIIIWYMKKDSSPFVNENGKSSINFQITVTIAIIISGILCFIFIGFILLPIIGILSIVFAILKGMNANKGEISRYPYSMSVIK
ncbi:MAG: DUF4870 domain-containing protein [Bacteroidales bacterium]